MCLNNLENGYCLIAKIPCEKVILCSPDSVYIDKSDEPTEEDFKKVLEVINKGEQYAKVIRN